MKTTLAVIGMFTVGSVFGLSPGDTFANPTVGFAVTKPTAWQFVTAEQHMENLSRTHLDDKEM